MTFFEREGAELIYDVEDHQFGSYRCTIKLPIADDYGRSIQAECEEKHCKRKEIIHRCILEACRLLDEHGVLRDGTAVSSVNTPRIQQLKRQFLQDNDFYEEDEDTFFDRTGDLEKKRLKRMEWSGHVTQEKSVETFDSLCSKLTILYKEQVDLEHKLQLAKEMEDIAGRNASKKDRDTDEVDLYIRQLKQGEKLNMKVKWQWRKRLLEIENDERRWIKLLKVCKSKEFDIQVWRQQIREELKENLTRKKLTVSKPVVVEEKSTCNDKALMLPPPPPSSSSSLSTLSRTLPSSESVPIVSSIETTTVHDQLSLKQEHLTTSKSANTRRKATHSTSNSKDQYDDSEHYSEDKFAGWMPPENEQTGDGRTALNDKYGY
jgi:hypothetical protein